MAGIKELIRTEEDNTLSFGNYDLPTKGKVSDYVFDGDVYKVKTFHDITRLEKNETFAYESTPGTVVTDYKETDPCQRDRLLLDAALAEGRDDLGGQLGVAAHHQPIGPPHLDAAGVDGPAVEVFGLALDAGCPRRGRERGQLEGLGEGQLLLGLAQPRPLFALIIHGTAQISFQRQPPGGQLLLQHHRLCEALDDALHRRQIVRDQ